MEKKKAPVMSMAFVVTGNMLGAGILALPIKTGLAGFVPSLVGIVLMWILMLSTAFILASQKSLTQSATADLPTFFQHELGTAGKWITVVANLIILYGLLVAYISGAASVLQGIFKTDSPTFFMIIFFCGASFLTMFGMQLMRKGNTFIMIGMWVTFAILVVMCLGKMDPSWLTFTDWEYLPCSLPIVVTAFHFHNIIPSICRNMDYDQKAIRKSMFIGTFIGLIMNIIWVTVVIASLPLDPETGPQGFTILDAFQQNLPATVPLAHYISSPMFKFSGLVFAILAMGAAYMANGTALSSFIRDLTTTYLHTSSRVVAYALAFLPPLAVAIIYPDIFLKALDVVGGVGIDLIFGILPGVLLIKYNTGKLKAWGWFLVCAFAIVLVYEIGQELGMLRILPSAEYWATNHLP